SINPQVTSLNWVLSQNVIPATTKLPVDHTAFPLTAYMRLFAPFLIPASESKVIYMDVDMIVLEDISKLWHTDIGNNIFAAVQDHQKVVSCEWGGIPNYKALGIPADTKYFNSGLLLINTKKWIEAGISNKVIRCMNDNMAHVNYADQYGLNVAMYNQWFELDSNWNCFAAFDYETPYIIHFLDIKPIFKSYNSKKSYQEEFFKYLNMTAWSGFKPISNYKRLYRKIQNKAKKIFMGSKLNLPLFPKFKHNISTAY
ncbi:glycosyltransferase family 8 protein, partial [Pontibacter qinzhouensis]